MPSEQRWRRLAPWFNATFFPVAAFFASWQVFALAARVDNEIALGIAALVFAVVAAPLVAKAQAQAVSAGQPDIYDGRQVFVGNLPIAAPSLQPRTNLLNRLRDLRQAGHTAVIATVTGARGVGKTQLAAAYAREALKDGWQFVVWLDAQTQDRIIPGLVDLARKVGIDTAGRDPDVARRAVDWMQSEPGPGLVVFDNAEDPRMISAWTPTAGNLQVIITTIRYHAFDEIGKPVDVGLFSDDEARQFLRERTKLVDPDGEQRLIEELDHLPLALGQAAAVIGAGRPYTTYAAYLARLGRTTVDEHMRDVAGGYPLGLARAVQVSVEQLAQADARRQDATRLLHLLAVVDPTGIDVDLIKDPARWRDRQTDPTVTQPLDHGVDIGVALLVGHALATTTVDGVTVAMHRLTQRVIRERLGKEQEAVRRQVAKLIEEAILVDTQSPASWPACAKLLPHAVAVMDMAGPAIDQLVQYLAASGDYATALVVWRLISEARSNTFGAEHRETLAARAQEARLVGLAGDAGAARDQFRRLVDLDTRVLGASSEITRIDNANLAVWTGLAGDAAGARDLLRAIVPDQARRGERARTLGEMVILFNLAAWTGQAGDPASARDLTADLLQERGRIFGPRAVETLSARASHAFWTGEAGDARLALVLYLELLPTLREVCGPDHPNTLKGELSVARWTAESGDVDTGCRQYHDLLPRLVAVLGSEHPDTLTARANLAAWTGVAGDAATAIAMYREVLPVRERVSGAEHPETVAARVNLACWTGVTGDAVAARDALAALVVVRERISGPEHPETLTTRAHLATWTGMAGDPSTALASYQQLVAVRKRVSGERHPDTLAAKANLGYWLGASGDMDAALGVLRPLLALRAEVSGADHPETQTVRENIAYLDGLGHRPDAGTE